MFDELSLNLLDIGMNSLAAGASVLRIVVIESHRRDWLILQVRDNGCGMDDATLQRILAENSSTKANRKKSIGLGLALLRQTSEMCGGTFHVRSTPGKGTTVTASMRLTHIDRPPLGDLTATIETLAASPTVDVQLHYRNDNQTFHFHSQEAKHHEPSRTPKTKRKSAEASRAA